MKTISELLKDLEALKRKNGEGVPPSPQSYKSYMEVFKAFVPTYNRIVEILEEIESFDRVKYGRGATAARLTAGYSPDKERSMGVSLNTNRYQREAVLSFRNGSEEYTMYPVEFSEFAGSNDNFFAIFTNRLINHGFATEWVLDGLGKLFQNLLTVTEEERKCAEEELDEALAESGGPAEGTFTQKLYELWNREYRVEEKKLAVNAEKVSAWLKSFLLENGEEIAQTADIVWKAREILGHLPRAVANESLFDEHEQMTAVLRWDEGYALSLSLVEKPEECGDNGEGSTHTYRPSILSLKGYKTNDNLGAIYPHIIGGETDEWDDRKRMKQFIGSILSPEDFIAKLPAMGGNLMKKYRRLREVIAGEVERELERKKNS